MTDTSNEELSTEEIKENLESEDEAKEEKPAENESEVGGERKDPSAESKESLDYKAKFFYLAAEMDNLQKRHQRDRESLVKYGNEKILTDLIEVMDNFERTLKALGVESDEKTKNIVQGIEMVRGQFSDILKKYGLTAVETLGKEFDPNFHEAVSKKSVEDKGDHEILEEYQKGYVLNGRLLRAAMVAVNSK